MRRWNGWGEETISSPLSPAATTFIRKAIGIGTPTRDATLEEVIVQVPPPRLPTHPLICTDPTERVRHARTELTRLDCRAQWVC